MPNRELGPLRAGQSRTRKQAIFVKFASSRTSNTLPITKIYLLLKFVTAKIRHFYARLEIVFCSENVVNLSSVHFRPAPPFVIERSARDFKVPFGSAEGRNGRRKCPARKVNRRRIFRERLPASQTTTIHVPTSGATDCFHLRSLSVGGRVASRAMTISK